MPEAVYHNNCGDEVTPLFSSSIAKVIALESELHAWAAHPLLGGKARKTTAAMSEGKIVDALICGDTSSIAVTDEWENFKTKAAQDWRDDHLAAGRTPIVRAKFAEYEHAAKVMRKRLGDAGCVFGGLWQPTILFSVHASNGAEVKCKARLDHLDPVTGLITDVKKIGTTAKPGRRLAMYIDGLGYDIQAALYPIAVEQLMPDLVGRSRFEWAFVEPEYPHAVARVSPSGSMRAYGTARLQDAIDRWERALRLDKWPGYEGVTRVEALPYMLENARIEEVSE
jgi:hypothetical protein